ncbi:ferritin [Actinocatenispora rupis]|uniref:Ferritin n=1 Tax=Actinocatenispora rupis TaxID=519421 RepID=A0A8J3J5D6_9ACTN|nr:ferritin [Actinocatenispora rupis]GID14438.1 ferritin [Actinocatenispora rupis]
MAVPKKLPRKGFHNLLREQVRNEFTAAQQYVAVAVWFDNRDLPRLAAHFYRQALEERNHAMMMVQYLMDLGQPVTVPGVDEVRNDFDNAEELIALALQQERDVADEIDGLMAAARAEGDFKGEEFVHWFLREQVEEIAQMSTLLNVVRRSSGNLFDVEAFVARERVGAQTVDPGAPRVAGGAL